MIFIAEGKNTFLGARPFFITSSPAESGIKAMLVQRLFQALCLHDVRVERTAMGKRADLFSRPLLVDMNKEIKTQPLGGLITKRNHFLEFPRRIYVKKREWRFGGKESLHGEMQHDG